MINQIHEDHDIYFFIGGMPTNPTTKFGIPFSFLLPPVSVSGISLLTLILLSNNTDESDTIHTVTEST